MPFSPLTDARKKVLLILGVSRACSDAGGTTLCNDGDHCNYLQDLSGNGYHAVTNGANPAPIYRANGLGGQPYLDFVVPGGALGSGASLAVTPDAGLNAVQGSYDYTVYAFGTTGTAPIPDNGVSKFFSQCADADFSGVFDLELATGNLFGVGSGVLASAALFPNATGSRPYYVPPGSHARFGWTVNASAKYRMLWNGFGCGGNGSNPSGSPTDTTGNIILGSKMFTGWGDNRTWQGQWHGLCIYQTSLNAPEVWQLDDYLISLRSQAHAIAAAPYVLIWDGNSHAGINSTLAPNAVALLGINPEAVAQFAYHFKTTSDMITFGSEIDQLVTLMRAKLPTKRIVLNFHELTNDFGSLPAATLYQHYQTYATARLAGGVNALVAGTMLDQQSMSAPDETRRATLNGLVRTNASPPWKVADWAGDPGLEPWNPTDYGDSLHPNNAGNAAGAPYFANAIIAQSVNGTPILHLIQAACGGC